MYGVTYSTFINAMSKSNVHLNRKVLADMAFNEPLSFRSVLEVIKIKGFQPRVPRIQLTATDTTTDNTVSETANSTVQLQTGKKSSGKKYVNPLSKGAVRRRLAAQNI